MKPRDGARDQTRWRMSNKKFWKNFEKFWKSEIFISI